MAFVVQMLAHTPPYIFVLLAYLVWQGVLSLRERRLAVWRMLIVPCPSSGLRACSSSSAAIRRHYALGSLACRASGIRSARTCDGPRLLQLIARA